MTVQKQTEEMHEEDEENERVRTGVMTAGVKRVRTKKRNRR